MEPENPPSLPHTHPRNLPVPTWIRWSSDIHGGGSAVRHEVEHGRGEVPAVPTGGVQLHLAALRQLHLLIAGLRTDADAAADVLPGRLCRRPPVVVCQVAGPIVAGIFVVRSVCPNRVTAGFMEGIQRERSGAVAPHSPGRFRRRRELLRRRALW